MDQRTMRPSERASGDGTLLQCASCGLGNAASRKSCLLCASPLASEEVPPLPVDGPLLERARETSALDGVIDRFVRAREGAVVAVISPEGNGRTRLVRYAVEKLLAAKTVRVFATTIRAGEGVFAPVTRLVLDRFGIAPTRATAVARLEISAESQRVFDRKGVPSVDHLRRLMVVAGLGADELTENTQSKPMAAPSQLGESVARFFAIDAETKPIALVVDDLEMASDEGVAVLQELCASLARSPVMVIVATTPDRAGVLRQRARVVLEPEALSSSACEILCHHLLPGLAVVPDELLEAVVTRAAGAPGRVRELLLALIESRVVVTDEDPWSIDLDALGPSGAISTADLLHVRVSRLDDDDRATLGRAAVVGEVFWEGAVCAMARVEEGTLDASAEDVIAAREHDALRRLVNAELLAPIEDSELAFEREYVFTAAGLRELMLNDQADELRRRRHDVCAGWLELAAGSRADDLSRAIAGHLERAGLYEAAARAYLRAARIARLGYRGKQAVELFNKALAFLPQYDAPARIDALHDKGVVLSLLGRTEEADQTFHEMLAMAFAYGARNKMAAALGRLGRLARGRGEFETARAYLWRALELFQLAEDTRGVAAVQDDLGMVAYLAGDFDTAIAHSQAALDIRRGLDDPLGEALSTHNLGLVHLSRGQPRQARAHFERALALREKHNDIEGQFLTRNVLAAVAFERGEFEVAEKMWTDILQLAQTLGDRRTIAYSSCNLGEAAVHRADPNEAKRLLDQSDEVAQQIGDRRVLAEVERVRAALARLLGDAQTARVHLEQSLAIAQSLGAREAEALAFRGLGEVYAMTMFDASDSAEQADVYFRQAIELLEALGATRELARTRSSYGIYLVERGDLHEARRQLTMAVPVLDRLELAEATPARRALSTAGGELPVMDISS